MIDVLTLIPGKKKISLGGWHSFNAVCCHHRGHKSDSRGRGGILLDGNNWIYSCFNCGFKAGLTIGKTLTSNTRLLLTWCGVSADEIDKINFWSYSQRIDLEIPVKQHKKPIDFEEKKLPELAVPLDINVHHRAVNYIESRGLSVNDYPYWVLESDSRSGIIIPYYYKGKLVGHTTRFYDSRKPKYISDQHSGYVFNIDAQHPDWKFAILVEGQFDAISIGGIAYMRGTISTEQQRLINTLNREIIVVPDHDKTGMEICDLALDAGYRVSIPDWHTDIKDVNDAVKKYGKIATLLSIIQAATTSKIKIEMARKRYR